jgi:hypothetical protein
MLSVFLSLSFSSCFPSVRFPSIFVADKKKHQKTHKKIQILSSLKVIFIRYMWGYCFFSLSVTGCRLLVFSESSGFLHQWNWPPRYNWNIVESGVKHPLTYYNTCVQYAIIHIETHFWHVWLIYISILKIVYNCHLFIK